MSDIHEIPSDRKMTKEEVVRAIRTMIIAEQEAVQLYTKIVDAIPDNLEPSTTARLTKILKAGVLSVVREERIHVGEFERLLALIETDEPALRNEGQMEVDKLIGELSISTAGAVENLSGIYHNLATFGYTDSVAELINTSPSLLKMIGVSILTTENHRTAMDRIAITIQQVLDLPAVPTAVEIEQITRICRS